MYQHLLVPTDGTELSTDTVSRAVEFARAVGARITFFHAKEDYAAGSEGALMYSLSPEIFVEQSAGEARAFLAKAEAAARAAGVSYDSRVKVSDRPYEAILEVAEACGCDLIFMASHGRRGIKGLMVGSQTLKVLAQSRIPVLVSTSESNAPSPTMNRALAIIQDEHRSVAVVVHALKYLARETREKDSPPNFPLLKAMLYYIEAFPEALHHPKEDAYLFRKLRERTHEADELIDELLRQHVEDVRLVKELKQALANYEAGDVGGFDAFSQAIDRFADFIWQHMHTEEKMILSAARKHLAEEDWADIAEAFGKNGDPRFGEEKDKEFRGLFAKIVNLSPQPVGGGSGSA